MVITGVGPITSIGAGKEAFWDSLKAGRSGIAATDNDAELALFRNNAVDDSAGVFREAHDIFLRRGVIHQHRAIGHALLQRLLDLDDGLRAG